MDLYCVMGNPIEHSRSPWLHTRFAELTGQSLRYERRLVPLGDFAQAVRHFREAEGGLGCNVTVPFKFEAAGVADVTSERARLAGAVNVLSFRNGLVHADNSDGIGLVADIERNAGVPLAGLDILLIGAGGAAAGVLGPLLEARPRGITLVNRTQSRAADLAARHAPVAARTGVQLAVQDLQVVHGSFDVVINASASSLAGGPPPVSASVLKPGALACDLMYGAAAQPFLQWARERGARPRDGLGMLVEQAAEAFEAWRGVRPPSARVLAELQGQM